MVNKLRKKMSHINFKMTGTNTIKGGYDDITQFKTSHLIDTPGYVDDTGILEKFEDKLTNSIIKYVAILIISSNKCVQLKNEIKTNTRNTPGSRCTTKLYQSQPRLPGACRTEQV